LLGLVLIFLTDEILYFIADTHRRPHGPEKERGESCVHSVEPHCPKKLLLFAIDSGICKPLQHLD
jgi:hypothetical protein